jgi:hypothetical protein
MLDVEIRCRRNRQVQVQLLRDRSSGSYFPPPVLLAGASRRYSGLFAHWRFGLKPDGWTMGAR